MLSAEIIKKKYKSPKAAHARPGVENPKDKPRAALPGAAFFAIPVSIVFTAWATVNFGLSLWWALPLYSLIGAAVIVLFAVLPRT